MKKNNLIILALLCVSGLSFAGTATYPHNRQNSANNHYHNQCYNAKGKVTSCKAAKLECKKITNSKERGLCFSKVRNVKSGAYR